jgi:DNA-binding beta-propeller fold protein YncE
VTRQGYRALARTLAWLLCAASIPAGAQPDGEPRYPPERFVTGTLSNPSHVIRYRDRYVATELLRSTLAVFEDFSLEGLRRADTTGAGLRMYSPHFLAVSPRGTLLVTEGWGTAVVELDSLAGDTWRRFSGKGKRFSAPHGICVDADGWIYVADSLNSRLVRFRDMTGEGWEVFADRDRRIAYGRQLVCDADGVWIANTYEDRPGLNPGKGANVLRIRDFRSGVAEVALALPDGRITGIHLLPERRLLLALWGPRNALALADLRSGEITRYASTPPQWGAPYGISRDPLTGKLLVAYFGTEADGVARDPGGIAVYGPPGP